MHSFPLSIVKVILTTDQLLVTFEMRRRVDRRVMVSCLLYRARSLNGKLSHVNMMRNAAENYVTERTSERVYIQHWAGLQEYRIRPFDAC